MNQDNNINQYINTSIDTKSHTGTKLERCSCIKKDGTLKTGRAILRRDGTKDG